MWQVFLSHSSTDADFARKLARDLKSRDIAVWFAEWEMRVGDSLRQRIEEGIQESGYLGVVLSPDSVKSKWVQTELNAGLEREMRDKAVFVLPIMHRKCEVPQFLRDKVYADFTEDYESGIHALLQRLDEVAYGGAPDAKVLGSISRKEIETLLDGIAERTNTGVSIVQRDTLACITTSQKKLLHPYCRAIRRCREADRMCYRSDQFALLQVGTTKAPIVYEGHPGLLDTCAPVEVDGEVVAALFSGQIRIRKIDKALKERLHAWEKSAKLPPDSLVSALREIPLAETSDIEQMIQTLTRAAKKISAIWSEAEDRKTRKKKRTVQPKQRSSLGRQEEDRASGIGIGDDETG